MNISDDMIARLRSPRTGARLEMSPEMSSPYLVSADDARERYPVVEGVPILINDEKSLFFTEQFKTGATTTVPEVGSWTRWIKQVLSSINANIRAESSFQRLVDMMQSPARVLVVGGRRRVKGSDVLYEASDIEIVSADVAFGPETDLICDAHDFPFQDETFDAVVAQAVLEHVVDPYRCVAEIHRVLKLDGIVHAETPFLQSMHMQPYDFTRFTLVGYRRLFSRFDLIKTGPTCGPGMALAWSYRGFLQSMARSKRVQKVLVAVAHLTAFPHLYFDTWLIDRPGPRANAFGYFFAGRKREEALPDAAIIEWFESVRRES